MCLSLEYFEKIIKNFENVSDSLSKITKFDRNFGKILRIFG